MTSSRPPAPRGPAPVALDAHVSSLAGYANCQRAIRYWQNELDRYKSQLIEIMGDATSGTVEGHEVLTYEPVDRFRGKEFQKAYPDMWNTYTRTREVTSFDVDYFRMVQPELYARFQVRALRNTYGG
jgi:hypothetical protein